MSASIGRDGAWLAVGAPHTRHGFVELVALPVFQQAWRGDPDAVRRYRDWMTQDAFRFLNVELGDYGGEDPDRSLRLDGAVTACELRDAHYRREILTVARPGESWVEQRQCIRSPAGEGPRRLIIRFRGRLDVHPLPEITEVSPPVPTGARTRLVADGDRLAIVASEVTARAEIRVAAVGAASTGWVVEGDKARLELVRDVAAPELELVLACLVAEGDQTAPRSGARDRPARRPGRAQPAEALAGLPWRSCEASALCVPSHLRRPITALAERARAYVRSCTAVRIGPEEVCLLTDHRILPLSWTRDAYWQAALLLADRSAGGDSVDLVADHLRWLWARCERPDGLWMRSHLPGGAIKDRAVQADQQLYPVLELADFRRAAGELPRAPGQSLPGPWWARQVTELWSRLPVSEHGLLRSDENPADDHSELPFQLSTQILYWLTATRLAELRDELGLQADFMATAERAAAAIGRHFTVEGPLGRQWAYEVDGEGGHRLYQDANDLPTALAPLLGFCSPADELWATTMRYAFSPHNPVYRSGPWGGLGSLHTPGTWTLGDLQEWVAGCLLGEPARAQRALERLVAVASPDGLLPEAYDAETGGGGVRHWFAWPGATLAALLPLAR